MTSEVKFKVIEFDYGKEQFIVLTHDWLNDQADLQDRFYGVELIDSAVYKGPEDWIDDVMEDITQSLEDIQQYHIPAINSPYYYREDTSMVCNTYARIISQFNECYEINQNTAT